MKILTINGELEESLLVKTEGRFEDDNEIATWQEWRLDGELVKRDAQVQLKKWPQGMAEAGLIGRSQSNGDPHMASSTATQAFKALDALEYRKTWDTSGPCIVLREEWLEDGVVVRSVEHDYLADTVKPESDPTDATASS